MCLMKTDSEVNNSKDVQGGNITIDNCYCTASNDCIWRSRSTWKFWVGEWHLHMVENELWYKYAKQIIGLS